MAPRRKKKSIARPKREGSHTPTAIGSILDALKGSTALGKQLDQSQIWSRWPEIAGEYLAAHGFPKSIKDSTLYIEVDSAVWLNKFAYHKWDLLKRINRLTDKELVSEIFLILQSDAKDPPPQPGA